MQLVIDGIPCTAESGETILQVARRNRIDIPTLCHHDALEGVGACRLCVVAVRAHAEAVDAQVVASCMYAVKDGLQVDTATPEVRRLRQTVLDLLAARCPDAPEIQALRERMGGDAIDYAPAVDGSKCIMCYRCVRACEAIGCNAIAAVNRGPQKEIAPPFFDATQRCIGCGTCAAVCPTGHIAVTETPQYREIWSQRFAMAQCAGCGAPFMTEATREHLAGLGKLKPDYFTHCAACRQRDAAARFVRVGT